PASFATMQDALKPTSSSISPRWETRAQFFISSGGQFLTSPDIYQGVVDERIDAAILVKPPFDIPKTLEWHKVRSERFVLLAPIECPIAPSAGFCRSSLYPLRPEQLGREAGG
ncbi:hypothetical protein ACFFP0_30870, partial [Rhizobium puerariae]